MAKKTNGLFINGISENLIHANTSIKEDGTERNFYNVSIPMASSKTGWASVSVAAGQVITRTNKAGVEYKSIYLGKPETKRQVSIATTKTTGKYKVVEMTNQEIKDAYDGARAAYKKELEAAAE